MLNPRQQRFVEEYPIDSNATQSAIRAGYAPGSAKVTASRLLTNANVREAIRGARERLSSSLDVDAERVILEYARIAFADPRDVLEWDAGGVTLKDSSELSEDAVRAVAEVSETAIGVRVKMHDKVRALDSLARHLGLFAPERVDLRMGFTWPGLFERAMEFAAEGGKVDMPVTRRSIEEVER